MTTYRVVVSREAPWWTAVAYGEGLPQHGAATETRTIADIEEKLRELIVLRTDADLHQPYEKAARSFDFNWHYDLPDDAAEALRAYLQSKRDLAEAQNRYASQAERAAAALTTAAQASVRDVAVLMGLSYQRVSQLLSALRQRRTHPNRPARRRSPDPAGTGSPCRAR